MTGKAPTLGYLLKIILVAAVLFVPVISGELGWIRTFIPLPIFFILVTRGESEGKSILTKSMIAAGLASMLTGSLFSFIMSLTFVPIGYMFSRALQNRESVLRTGTYAALTLTAIWVVVSTLYGMIEHVHPYRQILEVLDTSLASTYSMYEESSDMAPETLAQIEIAFTRVRYLIPVIFPAIVIITALFTVWINLLLGDMLIKRKDAGLITWLPYSQWRLPDQLVWIIVLSGAGLLLPLPLVSKICLNSVLVCTTLYFFQGMVVLSSLFNRWSIPWAFRLFVYTLILIQAYGILFLAIAGLVDVWFDLRKSKSETNDL